MRDCIKLFLYLDDKEDTNVEEKEQDEEKVNYEQGDEAKKDLDEEIFKYKIAFFFWMGRTKRIRIIYKDIVNWIFNFLCYRIC